MLLLSRLYGESCTVTYMLPCVITCRPQCNFFAGHRTCFDNGISCVCNALHTNTKSTIHIYSSDDEGAFGVPYPCCAICKLCPMVTSNMAKSLGTCAVLQSGDDQIPNHVRLQSHCSFPLQRSGPVNRHQGSDWDICKQKVAKLFVKLAEGWCVSKRLITFRTNEPHGRGKIATFTPQTCFAAAIQCKRYTSCKSLALKCRIYCIYAFKVYRRISAESSYSETVNSTVNLLGLVWRLQFGY